MDRQRVLVAMDGSEGSDWAAAYAASLLWSSEVEVRIVTVLSFELYPVTMQGEELVDTPDRAGRVALAVERATARGRCAFESAGLPVSAVHRFGNAADEILAEATDWRADLLVLGRRGLRAPTKWLVGSVSDRVLHHAKVPILLIPSVARSPIVSLGTVSAQARTTS
jgi:nucleotide-binding universal stress UspA family protein